ncbi:ABC transporter permease [Roseomonas sp. BN140053]|uniref:ABC transporter permease n=1 Tax=Roseomonas sp. BN140053 TaxID=3391898 RepID=UPI0039EA003B
MSETVLPAAPAPARRRVRLPIALVTTPLLAALLIGLWQFYVTWSGVSAFILPSPLSVWDGFVELLATPSTWRHTLATVQATLSGFLIALVLGVAMGAVLAKVPWLEQTMNPFIVASQVVPKVALVPLFVVWFGFGMTSKVVIAAVIAFFPIFTGTLRGVKSVDLGHRDVMTAFNANPWQRAMLLELPSALPYILVGAEVGIVLAIIGAVIGEYLGGNLGLGYLLIAKMNAYETDMLFAVILLLTLVGFLFYLVTVLLRRAVIPWHESVAGPTR